MSLAEAFAARLAAPEDRCPVADLLASLPEADAAALRRVLEPRVMDADAIRRILRANGHAVPQDPLRAHKAAVARARGVPSKSLPCGCTDL